jgi:hypothetical protein
LRRGGIAGAAVYAYISLNALSTLALGVNEWKVFVASHMLWGGALVASIVTIVRPSYVALFTAFAFGVGLERSTPLWYYILKEAEVIADGLTLTGVGARVVGEVILCLLELDENSYLSRRWHPTLPRRARETFDMVDLLTFAGVDPGTRGQ